MTPRSCLRWKPTGKIFKIVCLRWVPSGKIFTSSTTRVDSEPTNGSNDDITNQYECEQTLDFSAGTLSLSAVQNSEFMTTTMNRPIQSWFQKLFLQQTRQLHHDKCWNYDKRCLLKMSLQASFPQRHKSVNYDNSDPVPPRQNVVPTAEEDRFNHNEVGIFFFSPYLKNITIPAQRSSDERTTMNQAPNAIISRS
ncbi:hypothetical protein Tco_0836702 [Tanacetum coccineum]